MSGQPSTEEHARRWDESLGSTGGSVTLVFVFAPGCEPQPPPTDVGVVMRIDF
jgi:hypothetical protein